ncbi:substrate-binding protein [Belliella buryatensis]|uniref:Substrate-binding protein n=1 Tax=Belliella buryatensis TaxID=1500549 RepID=A0A239GSX1_9BACT|nr:helical backbone metal receptor [Belliella buryatensis]SNS72316.1 substrate-binding protein [Belliella buryatensis]
MPTYTDQLNRKVVIPEAPQRIISLVPSQTELLVDLGLRDELVGITKFCIHPKGLKKDKQIIGGTKNFHFDKIDALQPDLIIGNKEENYQEGIAQLAEKYPVWVSDIYTLKDSLEMIAMLAEMTGVQDLAQDLIAEISTSLQQPLPKLGTAIYLIWNNPIMCAGQDNFINEMLNVAGFENLIQESRYPELSISTIASLNPDFLLLSSEPFPFKDQHLKIFEAHLPQTKIMIVDGELFSWYGSRLKKSMNYFNELHRKINNKI